MIDAWDIPVMPFQNEFCSEVRAEYLTLMAGRRAGKTHAIQTRMKIHAATFSGFRIMYITPLSSQGLEVYKQIISDPYFFQYLKYKQMRPYPLIVLKNKSQIWFRSFQRSDNIRSTGEDEVYGDEIQELCYSAWNIATTMVPLLSDRIYPITNDGTRGRLILAGQFRGENHIYDDYWIKGQKTIAGEPNKLHSPIYRSWQIPSSAGHNYNTPGGPEKLAQLKAALRPSVYDQEYDCIPRANQNACYLSALIDKVSTLRNPKLEISSLEKRYEGETTVTGVDVGEIIDYSAVVVVNIRGNIVYSETMPRQKHTLSAERAAQIAKHFNSQTIIMDATGGGKPGQSQQTYTETLKLYRDAANDRRLHFEPFFFQNKKKHLVANLETAMQQDQIGIPAIGCEKLLKQLKSYEYKHNPKTNWTTYSAPSGQHDDELTALLIAWDGFLRGKANYAQLNQYTGSMA